MVNGEKLAETGINLLKEKKIWYDDEQRKKNGSPSDLVADCQAFMELIAKEAGAPMSYAGSNDMFRHACTWTGTLGEAKLYGKLKKGTAVFIHDNGEPPKRYQSDGLGNFSHVGMYVGDKGYYDPDKKQWCDVIHSSKSRGKACGSTLKNGWTHAGVLKIMNEGGDVPMQTMYVTSTNGGNVNLRSGMSVNSTRMASLPVGTEVQAGEASNGWTPVVYNGMAGYIMNAYLTTQGSEAPVSNNKSETVAEIQRLLNKALELMKTL